MSLIDKQFKVIQIQNELNSKLAEMNYKSFKGTRQSMRNFREEHLKQVKFILTTPHKIELQKKWLQIIIKKEEERLENIKACKTKSALHDTIETELVDPKVIPFGSTSVPATLQDLNDKADEITNLVNQITGYDEKQLK